MKVLILALSSALLLAACSSSEPKKEIAPAKPIVTTPTKAPAAASDGSGAMTTASGLRYKVLASGPAGGVSPTVGDTVVVHSMDRLARNLDDLRRLVQSLTRRGVRIEFVKEHLTFTGEDSPMANLMLSVMGAFAEFERALIRERQREGIALAKQRGAYRGRKKSLSSERIAELRQRVEAGEQKTKLAREFGISRETLYQYLRTDQ